MGRPRKTEKVEIVHDRNLEFGETAVTAADIRETLAEDLDAFREYERDVATGREALTSDEL